LASVGCAVATNVETLIAMRFLQALAAAAGPIGSRSSVRDRFEPAEAAGIFGLLAAIFAVVPMVAPALGGLMQEHIGWAGNFWVMGGYAVLLCLLFLALMPESLDPALRQPIRPLAIYRSYATLLRDSELLSLLIMVSGIYAGLFAFLSGSSFIFQELYGLPPSTFGVLFGIMVSGFFVGSLITRPLTRRLGTQTMLKLGMSMVGLAGLAYGAIAIDGIGSPTAVIAAQTIFALGVGISSPQISAAAMANYPHMAGTAAALQGFTQLVSGAISGYVVGLLYDGTARPMTTIITLGCAIGVGMYLAAFARKRA
ncbi:MAG: MFS transporter, partial [Alphaproteobacteria bacterium]